MNRVDTHRYTRVAIALHWAIAIAILAQIPVGIWMSNAQDALRRGDAGVSQEMVFTVFQLHKSVGLTVLVLSVARLAWRLMNPPPPLPDGMAGWEKAAAHAVHAAFYVLIIAIPLAGWAVVSSSRLVIDTHLFLQDWLPWPNLPIARTEANEAATKTVHQWLAYLAGGLVVVHVGAALKHQILAGDGIFARMLPGVFGRTRGPVSAGRGGVLVAGLLVSTLAGGLAWGYVDHVGGAAANAVSATVPSAAAPNAKIGGESAIPSGWVVNRAESAIRFVFNYSGDETIGRFDTWTADIDFDRDNLGAAKAVVHIDTRSAVSGDDFLDSELPGGDGFDTKGHPEGATFEAAAFRALGDGGYEIDGRLTIRNVTRPVTLPFTLAVDGDEARATGQTVVRRSDFGIGGDGVVGDEIRVEIVVVARRAAGAG